MRIRRGDDPGPFSRPRDYVTYLRALFRHRCAYCLTPDDRLGGEEGMNVDHFLPESRRRDLRLAWANLYYSCDVCNNRKSDYPTAEEVAQGMRFVDPCAEDPDEHFRLAREPESGDHCRVVYLSEPAKYMIFRLQFNRRPFLRDFWRELDAAERKWTEHRRFVMELQAQIGGSAPDAESLLARCESELASIQQLWPFLRDE